MSGDDIQFSDAMKDPESREQIESFVMYMRIALAPVFNGDPDKLPMNQSYAMTAAALFAGMTAGHMIALGVLNEQDKRRAGQMLLTNFRNGIEIGKREARDAMLKQMPAQGNA
ncbi:MAG TPA: hypothetical protein VFW19_10455 [Allosphingosinicella sp.]|nr:hypothetical protein [Allosphingosinicella sp.]